MQADTKNAGLREGVSRWLAQVFGDQRQGFALPLLSGPGRGLWFRAQEQGTLSVALEARRLEQLSKMCKEGWTIWDCGGSSFSPILFSRFVGNDGLVVSFESAQENFRQTYENANLNGCFNILYLFAEVGSALAARSFGPPLMGKRMALDVAYQDSEIPIPQMIRLDLGKNLDILLSGNRLITEKRPYLVIGKREASVMGDLVKWAKSQNYLLMTLTTLAELKNTDLVSEEEILCVPQEFLAYLKS